MKSTWISLRVDAVAVGLLDRPVEPLAERDVAGRVLVDQRVVEDGVERADAAAAVDQRQLAEAGGARVAIDVGLQHLAVRGRLDRNRPPALEAHLEVAHDGAVELARLRRAHDAVDPLGIRRREHLFGGQVGLVRRGPMTSSGRRRARSIRAGARRVRSVPGPLQVDGVEPALVERGARPLAAASIRSYHAATGSSASRRQTTAPSPATAARAPRPARGRGARAFAQPARRAGHDRPVVAGRVHVLDRLLAPRRPVAADAGGIDARPAAPARSGPLSAIVRALVDAVLAHHLDDPLRLVAERVVDRRTRAAPAGRRDRGRRCRTYTAPAL